MFPCESHPPNPRHSGGGGVAPRRASAGQRRGSPRSSTASYQGGDVLMCLSCRRFSIGIGFSRGEVEVGGERAAVRRRSRLHDAAYRGSGPRC